MRLDARIPVRIVSSTEWPPTLPTPDARAVLVIAGPAVPGLEPGLQMGWAAVRRLVDLAPPPGPDLAAHAAGCACCVVRAPLAMLFSALFEARARGTLSLFRQVNLLAPQDAAMELTRLLASDALVSGRYRIGEN